MKKMPLRFLSGLLGEARTDSQRKGRVDFQVFLMTALIVVASCSLIYINDYRLTYNSMIGDLRERALNIHEYLDDRLERQMFSDLNKREDHLLPQYLEAKGWLENTRKAAGVRYLYTAKQTETGDFIYLVDGLPSDSPDFRYVGDLIEPECIPDMQRALAGETVLPREIATTTWGAVFISYFPMHDGEEVVGVLGIEFNAENQYHTYRKMAVVMPLIILASCLVSAAVAVCLFRRISNPSYRDMSNTDFLTGLKNRNAFEVDLHNLEQKAEKQRILLLSIDLDNLKFVNDTFGHAKGDLYIKTGCRIIQEALGKAHHLYRIGGDEFAAVLTGNIFPGNIFPSVELLAERIVKKAEEENQRSEFPISLSVGGALYDPQTDATLSAALDRSDAEMYRAKREHKLKSSAHDGFYKE